MLNPKMKSGSRLLAIAVVGALSTGISVAQSTPSDVPQGESQGANAPPEVPWNLVLPPCLGHTGRYWIERDRQLHEGPGRSEHPDARFHVFYRDAETGRFGGEVTLGEEWNEIASVGEAERAHGSSEPHPCALEHGGERADLLGALLRAHWEKIPSLVSELEEPLLDPSLRLVLGHALLATNRNDESVALLYSVSAADSDRSEWEVWTRAMAAHHPDSDIARYLRGDSRARLGDWAGAQTSFDVALLDDSREIAAQVTSRTLDSMLLNARAVVLCAMGELDLALLDLVGAIEADPELADPHASLGARLLLISQGASAASRAFESAARLSHGFELARIGRGCADAARGEIELAMGALGTETRSELYQGIAAHNLSRLADLKDQWIAALEGAPRDGQAGTRMWLHADNTIRNFKIGGWTGVNAAGGMARDTLSIFDSVSVGKTGVTVGFGNLERIDNNVDLINHSAGQFQANHFEQILLNQTKLADPSTTLGGADLRVSPDLFGGRRWGLLSVFGLCYRVPFPKVKAAPEVAVHARDDGEGADR